MERAFSLFINPMLKNDDDDDDDDFKSSKRSSSSGASTSSQAKKRGVSSFFFAAPKPVATDPLPSSVVGAKQVSNKTLWIDK